MKFITLTAVAFALLAEGLYISSKFHSFIEPVEAREITVHAVTSGPAPAGDQFTGQIKFRSETHMTGAKVNLDKTAAGSIDSWFTTKKGDKTVVSVDCGWEETIILNGEKKSLPAPGLGMITVSKDGVEFQPFGKTEVVSGDLFQRGAAGWVLKTGGENPIKVSLEVL